jgi:hypothetical protein
MRKWSIGAGRTCSIMWHATTEGSQIEVVRAQLGEKTSVGEMQVVSLNTFNPL